MKKTLCVILAVFLLICCLPLSAGAEQEYTVIDAGYLAEHTYVLLAGSYSVPAGKSVTVPQGCTLYLDPGAFLDVYGSIDVQGKLISRGGVLTLKISEDGVCGLLKNSENVGGNSSDDYRAEILFARLPADFMMLEHRIADSCMFVSSDGSSYADLAPGAVFTGFSFGTKYTVRLNQYLFFKMKLVDGAGIEKYDSSLLKFTFNGVNIQNKQNVNQVLVSTAGTVAFGGSTVWDEDAYLRRFNVCLPAGTGYSVFGINGEASSDISCVQLKYGQEFMFRLDMDPEYNKSAYEVYCINNYKWKEDKMIKSLPELADATKDIDAALLAQRWAETDFMAVKFAPDDPAKCYIDENGYYHIPAEYMVRDCTIAVTGITKNETISILAKVVDMLRNLLDSIKSFFESILDSFK